MKPRLRRGKKRNRLQRSSGKTRRRPGTPGHLSNLIIPPRRAEGRLVKRLRRMVEHDARTGRIRRQSEVVAPIVGTTYETSRPHRKHTSRDNTGTLVHSLRVHRTRSRCLARKQQRRAVILATGKGGINNARLYKSRVICK